MSNLWRHPHSSLTYSTENNLTQTCWKRILCQPFRPLFKAIFLLILKIQLGTFYVSSNSIIPLSTFLLTFFADGYPHYSSCEGKKNLLLLCALCIQNNDDQGPPQLLSCFKQLLPRYHNSLSLFYYSFTETYQVTLFLLPSYPLQGLRPYLVETPLLVQSEKLSNFEDG